MAYGADRFTIRAGRVITATGAAPIEDGAVVVSGGRIEAVGPFAELEPSPDPGSTVSFPDGSLLPGLIDTHAHITLFSDGESYEAMAREPDEMMSLVAVRNMRNHMAGGVTTLRDNGGRNRVSFVVREAISRGYIPGPRLLLSGRPVTHSAGHFAWCNGAADGEVEIRSAIRQLFAEGADHIKIMASGGGTANNVPYWPYLTEEELSTAVSQAHELGLPTTAHCLARESMDRGMKAGLDCIEHAEFRVPPDTEGATILPSGEAVMYSDRTTSMILENESFVSLTLQANGYESILELRQLKEEEGLPPEEAEGLAELEAKHEVKLDFLARMMSAGLTAKITVSTDAGPRAMAFGRMHLALEVGVEAGMTPMQAIEAATRIPSEAVGLQDTIGTVEVGKAADLIVVDGDPTTDISDLRRMQAVYQEGRLRFDSESIAINNQESMDDTHTRRELAVRDIRTRRLHAARKL